MAVKGKTFYLAQPSDNIEVGIDWASWLAPNSATISSVEWTPSDTNLTVADTSFTGTKTTAYVTGGSEDQDYTLDCQITTGESVPRKETRTVTVRVAKKFS